MKQYDVSVIIPVYNCEKYVKKSVKSILDQDYEDLSKIQVILVDDGSTDNSLEVCNNLKDTITEFSIDIITGKNEGVSFARNKGIKAAKGKYILFIDADDFISKNAIRKLTKFFDEHYEEIDILTYSMYEYDGKTKEKKILQRYKDYFTETRVFDLIETYGAIQPTMNIMVKNFYADNSLFDEKVFFHEDILYNTKLAMKKAKIGYVKDVKYFYRVYGNSTTDYKVNPLYSFKQYMYVFETLFNDCKDENGDIPKYVQRIVLNVIRFRINQDRLFPYYLEGKEWEEAYTRIINIIKKIDNDTIMQYNQMDNYHKLYLINLKNENIIIHNGYNGIYSINDKLDNVLLSEDSIGIIINKFKFKNNKVYILGFLKAYILAYKEPKIYFKIKTKEDEIKQEEIKLYDKTVASKYKTQMEISKFYGFKCEFDITDIQEFSFEVKIENQVCNTYYFFNTYTPFNKEIDSLKIYSGDTRIQFKLKNNSFFVRKPNKETVKRDLKRSIERYNKIDKKINFFRLLARVTKKEKIWLYYDMKNVFDNAYVQFKHDFKINDEIKKYYILDGKKKNYLEKFSKKELKNVIKFGSLKHKLLFLNSDKILTSFSSLQEYCPFYTNYQYYKDILNYDLIYLQHGILHAHLPKMYSKMSVSIDKFVISSQFEHDNLINNYEYDEKDLIKLGMPRLDDKIEDIQPENKIIFAPSWREYLIGKNINRKRKINKNKFMGSKYYKETIKFLQDKKLLKVLKEKNIILDYKLHPIFEKYEKCFEQVINENITVSVGGTNLNKCKAFITDFSSFQFDFVTLKRPIIYFVPDMDEFKAGLHTYRELDLKYEDAFGKLCKTGNELVDETIKLIDNDFKMEPIYKERMDKFFFKVENRKDKLYEESKKI